MSPLPRLAAPLLLLAAALACGPAERDPGPDVAVEVDGVGLDRGSGAPVVILQERDGARSLPIWIGFPEAQAIASEIEHLRPPRPNTHDLAKRLVDRLHGSLERVVVTELRDGTYYAVIVLATRGQLVEVDARPSDAIALALRFGAPVYVREALFEETGRPPAPPPGGRST